MRSDRSIGQALLLKQTLLNMKVNETLAYCTPKGMKVFKLVEDRPNTTAVPPLGLCFVITMYDEGDLNGC